MSTYVHQCRQTCLKSACHSTASYQRRSLQITPLVHAHIRTCSNIFGCSKGQGHSAQCTDVQTQCTVHSVNGKMYTHVHTVHWWEHVLPSPTLSNSFTAADGWSYPLSTDIPPSSSSSLCIPLCPFFDPNFEISSSILINIAYGVLPYDW